MFVKYKQEKMPNFALDMYNYGNIIFTCTSLHDLNQRICFLV